MIEPTRCLDLKSRNPGNTHLGCCKWRLSSRALRLTSGRVRLKELCPYLCGIRVELQDTPLFGGTQYIHSHKPVHDIKALWTSRCTKCFVCTASTTAHSTYVKPRHTVGKLVIWTQAVWPQSAHQKPCPHPVSPSSAPPSGFSSSWWEDRNAFSGDTPP